jgi:8-oxo-dGTP pyrophosphatase MutT (NUDIX family)
MGTLPGQTSRPEPGKPTKVIASAGGVILDKEKKVLLLRRLTEGTWVLAKGRREPGESLEQTAIREVKEETGLSNITIQKKLGMVRYTFFWRPDDVNYKKTVHYFLMSADSSATLKLEPSFSEARWVPLEEAVKLLTFENDRRIVKSVAEGR